MPNRFAKDDPRESGLDKLLRVIYRLISELKINPKNPRTHSRRQIQQIARSLKAFGFVVPVLIDAWGNVIAGHGRILAALLLGLTVCNALKLSHFTAVKLSHPGLVLSSGFF
jgi:ParB-like chromosome segregation protein Spo0J